MLLEGGLTLSVALLWFTSCGAGGTDAAAERLAAALRQRETSWVAARDPSAPSRVIAAMGHGRRQLTVVAGTTDAPGVTRWLRERQYESVYRALTAVPAPRDGYILHDLNGLGLRARRRVGEAFDMYNPSGGQQLSFDGDWSSQHLSEAEYCAAFEQVEAQYARALTLLLSVLQPVAE